MNSIFYQSPIGELRIRANQMGICSIEFMNQPSSANHSPNQSSNPQLKSAIRELDLYFSGKLSTFKTPTAATGSPFQESVWSELQKLLAASTIHYGAIAERIGNPKASRAVGLANNRNPLPILVPCHRVVGKSGSLIGYAGELWRKEWLLKHEGALI
ncbi:methylated-DNA--[protein]-cysteine S-methyltransferase [Candidatus Pelagisphaera phototrophica]|uniref:methylated-DNA--[protein]-cysteine S-methyltransferase n=1 Tax=Candidatus Pelagisphaera phototrophica TaxID=2684113 RepID=UPI0019DC8BAC|nr:methylated-DNA--[protein]-cysteine S-methyltransferase [Candidatus Pelagisphaera phototrophica]